MFCLSFSVLRLISIEFWPDDQVRNGTWKSYHRWWWTIKYTSTFLQAKLCAYSIVPLWAASSLTSFATHIYPLLRCPTWTFANVNPKNHLSLDYMEHKRKMTKTIRLFLAKSSASKQNMKNHHLRLRIRSKRRGGERASNSSCYGTIVLTHPDLFLMVMSWDFQAIK